MKAVIKKWIIILFVIVVGGFLLFQLIQYRLQRNLLPDGTTIAGVDVSGLTLDQARQELRDRYYEPVYLYHGNEHVELDPHNVGFVLDMDAMLREVEGKLGARDERLAFASFVLGRTLAPISVPLRATHDQSALQAVVQSMADFLDKPARPVNVLTEQETIQEGEPGLITDVAASLPDAEDALYRPKNRVAHLRLLEEPAPEMSLEFLKEVIESKLQSFDGMGSVFVMDLQTGEEMGINEGVAMSGLSILKIAIFVEAYRALDGPPDVEQQQLFLDTATRSSNYGANLLLHIVAGEENTYKGADVLTESMHRLGLVNTFMAVPYDATPPAYRQTTYVTPANSRTDISSQPDATMQSTAEEIGSLLAMIYDCTRGGGTLLAVYPEQLTPDECQAIVDLMVLNEEGNLIRYGVPEGTPVSHKHGWAQGTHADAGIVFSPGGDFVLVEYLNRPGDWLVADESFPILREIARAAYNYFNMDHPYTVAASSRPSLIDPNNPFSESQATDEAATQQAEPLAQPDDTSTGAQTVPSPLDDGT